MKTSIFSIGLFICIIAFFGCKKETGTSDDPLVTTLPTITTTPNSNVTATSAQSGGTITSEGGSRIISRGVCWSQSMPTIADAKTSDGVGVGSFVSSLTNLTPNSFYVVRAYATNSSGTSYGSERYFNTGYQITVPVLTGFSLQSTTSHTASMTGEIIDSGRAVITARGFCYGTAPNPTLMNTVYAITDQVDYFGGLFDNLIVNTTYYFRAFATNSAGTGYSNELSITTAYRIGEGLGGGRIFFIDNSTLHGLIAAVSDQSGGARWNNTSNPYAPINAYSMGNGVLNTNNIITALPNPNHAAAVCRGYRGGGYSDWYLPSINELYALYLQKNIFGNFQPTFYWSSTASSTYSANAWAQQFGSGSAYDDQDKTTLHWIRAIRAF